MAEEDEGVSILNSSWALPTTIAIGIITPFALPLYSLSMGEDSANAFWDHALRSLDWSFTLRSHPFLLFVIGCTVIGLSYWLKNKHSQQEWWVITRLASGFVLGCVIAAVIIHLLLDVAYFRGGFVLIAATYSMAIIALLVILFPRPIPLIFRLNETIDWRRTVGNFAHVSLIILCALLMIPAIPAMLGTAAAPPSAPSTGYGSNPAPYSISTKAFAYPMPNEVTEIIGDVEDELEFSLYLSLPIIPLENRSEKIPLAIMLHGFGSPEWSVYEDWINHLSAKGMAVAYLQYPSDVHPDGADDFDLIEAKGMSNHPQHIPRSAAIAAGIEYLSSIALQENRTQWIDSILGNSTIDTANLWIGGHSLGAGLSFRTIDDALTRGWGNESLLIALEAPYLHSVDEQLRGDLSGLPDHTIAHIAISEDDTSVSPCNGAWHQKRIIARDGSGLLAEERILTLIVPSDRHGFPPMVASHYLQATPVHDTLADWGFYRRADAQADYLVSQSGDINAGLSAESYLLNHSWLSQMGEWSDGTPVNQMEVYQQALTSDAEIFSGCADEIDAWE